MTSRGMGTVENRLNELGLKLPQAAAPVATYVPYVITGDLLVVSGQLPLGPDGKIDPAHRGKLGGAIFINCVPDFNAVPAIMNGASDLIIKVFGERGRHARSTIGVAQLPLDAAVEVEGLFEIDA